MISEIVFIIFVLSQAAVEGTFEGGGNFVQPVTEDGVPTKGCVKSDIFDQGWNLLPEMHFDDCTIVSITNAKMGDEEAVKLAKAINKMKHLDSLYLHYNRIGDTGFSAIGTSLRGRNMYNINFRKNVLGDKGILDLGLALRRMTRLTYINLSGNQIGNGGKILGKTFRDCKILREVYLQDNYMDDEAIVEILNGLAKWTEKKYLTKIILGGNKFGQKGCMSIASGLGKLTELNSVDLSNSALDKQCIAIMSVSLYKLKKLSSLAMNNCHLESKSLKVLSYTISGHNRLRQVALDGNAFKDEDLFLLGKHVLESPAIQKITIHGGAYDVLQRLFPFLFGHSTAQLVEDCANDISRKTAACELLQSSGALHTPTGSL
jgi:hypothetical protein